MKFSISTAEKDFNILHKRVFVMNNNNICNNKNKILIRKK